MSAAYFVVLVACLFVLIVIDASNGKKIGLGSILVDLNMIRGSKGKEIGGEEAIDEIYGGKDTQIVEYQLVNDLRRFRFTMTLEILE